MHTMHTTFTLGSHTVAFAKQYREREVLDQPPPGRHAVSPRLHLAAE